MNGIGAQRLDHVAIDVTDVDRSKGFYGGLLGLREIPRPTSFTFGGVWYEIGPIRAGNAAPDILHLVCRPENFPPAPHHFCLWVDDVYAASKTIAAAGFEVIWDTRFKIPGIDRFFTRDPDGNRVEFQGNDKMASTEAVQTGLAGSSSSHKS
ncbi:MAG TPA: VOC family protein [Tepidisphaeraceae bacterium]|jgi:catechol 2,3-dioxygenase-like lactoylglutathione lyase family enzyme|nr:VOC family protein [Tepidisphaeraceae bacterium]